MLILVGVLVMLLALLVSEPVDLSPCSTRSAERREPLDFASHGLGDGKDFAFWPCCRRLLSLCFLLWLRPEPGAAGALCRQAEVQQALWLNGLMRFPLVLPTASSALALVSMLYNEAFVTSLAGAGGSPNYNLAVPVYIIEHMPVGIVDIALVALFAAAMSSLDLVINSLSATTMEDFVRRFHAEDEWNDARELLYSRGLTVAWGVITLWMAFHVDDIASTVLVAINKIGSLINGPVLGVFIMGLLTTRATGPCLYWAAGGFPAEPRILAVSARNLLALVERLWFRCNGCGRSAGE